MGVYSTDYLLAFAKYELFPKEEHILI
jgi:hypothetical protein